MCSNLMLTFCCSYQKKAWLMAAHYIHHNTEYKVVLRWFFCDGPNVMLFTHIFPHIINYEAILISKHNLQSNLVFVDKIKNPLLCVKRRYIWSIAFFPIISFMYMQYQTSLVFSLVYIMMMIYNMHIKCMRLFHLT